MTLLSRTALLLGAGLVELSATGRTPPPTETVTAASMRWAYPDPSAAPAATASPPSRADDRPIRVPGGEVTFRPAELANRFSTPDWRPSDHPPMPAIVAKGRGTSVMACGFCHLPTGNGRPENASLAGLPRSYLIEQVLAFRSGERRSAVGAHVPMELMTDVAKTATDAEIADAAEYFSALPRRSFISVVETAKVPKTRTIGWVYSRDPAGGSEPIGARIVEMPVDFERFEHRDPATDYIAYVPTGSIARGRSLVRTWGGGGALSCTICHGPDLRGNDIGPPLAGRSPTYIVRQLTDFRTGARHGQSTEPMQPVVATMRSADMIALAAYLGSLKPPARQ